MEDKISVIVPVYNVEAYVEDCVSSLRKQTYQNLEILLVDDGSTDRSGQICERLKKEDTRIRVIHKQNGGLSDARNTGIKMAKGSYYFFVDSDDYLESRTIEIMHRAIKREDAQIAVCNMKRVFQNGRIEDFYCPCMEEIILRGDERFQTLVQPSVCNKIFVATLFFGVSFPEGKFYEDTYVYHILCERAENIVLTGHDGYWYRCREGSILQNRKDQDKYFDYVEALWHRVQYLMEKEIDFYVEQACLSFYAAVGNAERHIRKTKENRKKFIYMRLRYQFVYAYLNALSIKLGKKQILRLWMLRYVPFAHSILYERKSEKS